MKIRMFRVLVIVVISLPNLAFKNQLDDEGFRVTKGHISFVKKEPRKDLVIEAGESLKDVCKRANKEIDRQVDHCDPIYFEDMLLEVCKTGASGSAAKKGQVSGSYRKPWYSMVDVDKESIDEFGSEPEKRAAEKIIDLKKNGANHVFDFTIGFNCT